MAISVLLQRFLPVEFDLVAACLVIPFFATDAGFDFIAALALCTAAALVAGFFGRGFAEATFFRLVAVAAFRTGAAAFLAALAGFADFAGAAAAIEGFALSMAGTAALVVVTVAGLFFGRPPFLANCASANILANASLASAISCACDMRRSCIARAFSSR